jgi:hypothetical protein
MIIPVRGPVEISHTELMSILARTLKKDVRFAQASPEEFVKTLGMDDDPSFAAHFKAVKIDQRGQLLAGVDKCAADIVGQPLTTSEQFIEEHRHLLT